MQIDFDRVVESNGAEGIEKQTGVYVVLREDRIYLLSCTKNGVGQAQIQIPVEAVGEVIAELRRAAGPNRVAKPVRMRVVDSLGNVNYLIVQNGDVNYVSSSGTPLALSNMFSDSVELGFELLDASSTLEMLAAAKKHGKYAKSIELV